MSEHTQAAIETTIVATSQKATVVGGGASFLGWVASIDWLAFLGIFIALVGLAINFYFSHQRNKREQAEHELRKVEHELRVKNLRGGCDVESK